jgi:PleD family two-component response regulator
VVQNQLVVLFSTALIALSTAVLIWTLLNRMVFGPLESFASVSKTLAEGKYDARISVPDTKDELALLGSTMNDMAERIQSHAGRLEAQVAKRTREFQEANEALGRANRDLANAVEELARLARTDGLTQLNNHRTFHERIKAEVKRSERSNSPLTLLMIDVDHFKQYNDTHGHPAGDKVLTKVAALMTESLRIRQTVFPGAEASQPNGRVTVSIGMAGWPMHGKNDVALIEAADQALYEAKRSGRDQVKLFDGGTS